MRSLPAKRIRGSDCAADVATSGRDGRRGRDADAGRQPPMRSQGWPGRRVADYPRADGPGQYRRRTAVTYAVTDAVRRQRQDAATVHGAYSAARIKAKAAAHRRRFLRHAGLKVADLDGIAAAHLHHWARGMAQLDLFDEAGIARRDYWVAHNATRRALDALERRLKELGLDRGRTKGRALHEHLQRAYGGDA